MSAAGLGVFLRSALPRSGARPAYVVVLLTHYILLHGGWELVSDSEEETYVVHKEAVYSLCINKDLYAMLNSKKEGDQNPSLGVLKYRQPVNLWLESPREAKLLTFAWCSVEESMVLCHILETGDSVQGYKQVGTLTFSISELVEIPPPAENTSLCVKNPTEALKLVVGELRNVFQAANHPTSQATNHPTSQATSQATSGASPVERIPPPVARGDPLAVDPGPISPDGRDLGGMLVGPHAGIFQPRALFQPAFHYDPIDPLNSRGEPWPDDVHGNLPRSLDPRPVRGGFFNAGFDPLGRLGGGAPRQWF
eukprot:Gregarina_sp_Poly_1__1738@NODE_1448_length_4128_cov_67_748092_g960_i0_p2_GENE_NODE_1448_length_4128_cov_67_748092_g960_i0NODE_1448_length_4128_cov_67_748092_g960_i0_p2_ORF_typecomplete_len309_score37_73PT/PF04886_12/0_0066_NODE_1448_length_4128_cov_67_748092_g960_i010241950